MEQTPVSASERWRNRGLRLLRFVRRALPFALGVLATLFVLLLYNRLAPHPHQLTLREVNDAVAQTLASATPPPAYSSIVYQIIRPSLVLIQTETPDADKKDQKGLGSGVIIDDQRRYPHQPARRRQGNRHPAVLSPMARSPAPRS